MRKILVVLALISSSLFAQNNHQKPEISHEERLEKLVVKLNLDEQQASRVLLIQREHHLKLKQLKETTKGTDKYMRSEIQALKKELNIKMRSVLNKEQYANYKRLQSRKQMNKKRPNKRPKHGNQRRF